MKITIKNFRCHANLVVEFDTNRIVLIEGKSGVGKSTLFDAIYWCMYKEGGRSVKVTPWETNNKTLVEITFSSVCIRRTTMPSTLRVITNQETLDGTAAQSYIDELYGDSNYWMATSYMVQEEHNPLLFGSASVKTDLINRLCASDIQPAVYIEKVKEKIQSISGKNDAMCKLYNTGVVNLREGMERHSISEEEMDENVKDVTEEIQNLQSLLEEKIESLTRLTMHIQKRDEILLFLTTEKELQEEQYYRELLDEWEKYTVYVANEKYSQSLQERLRILEDKIRPLPVQRGEFGNESKLYTTAEIDRSKRIEEQWNYNQEMTTSMEVEYDSKVLSDTIQTFSIRLQKAKQDEKIRKEYIRVEKRRREILESIDSFSEIQVTKQEMEGLEKEYTVLHSDRIKCIERYLQEKSLECPHCKNAVYYENGKLEKTTFQNRSLLQKELCVLQNERSERLQELKKKRKLYEQGIRNTTLRERLQNELSSLPSIQNPENEDIEIISTIEDIYHAVKNIQWISFPTISSMEMSLHNASLQRIEYEKEFEKVKQSLQDINVSSVPLPLISKKECLSRIEKIHILSEKKKELETYPYNLDESVLEIQKEIQNLRNELSTLHLLSKRNVHLANLIRNRDELSNLHKEIGKVWKDLDTHTRLLDYLVEAEFNIYYSICNTLNSYLDEITPTLFQKDIRMQVKTIKITAGKREKPSIHIVVIYNGHARDPREFSVGEKKRLSFAMTLAMLKFSKSPIVILDEIFAYLHSSDHENAIQIVHAHCKSENLVTLCVCHTTISGWYDEQYELKDTTS